jgi:hypothetical protein
MRDHRDRDGLTTRPVHPHAIAEEMTTMKDVNDPDVIAEKGTIPALWLDLTSRSRSGGSLWVSEGRAQDQTAL